MYNRNSVVADLKIHRNLYSVLFNKRLRYNTRKTFAHLSGDLLKITTHASAALKIYVASDVADVVAEDLADPLARLATS